MPVIIFNVQQYIHQSVMKDFLNKSASDVTLADVVTFTNSVLNRSLGVMYLEHVLSQYGTVVDPRIVCARIEELGFSNLPQVRKLREALEARVAVRVRNVA